MAVAEFIPARAAGSTIPSVLNAMGQGQSLMSRAQQMEQSKAEEARRQAEFALKLPLVEAQTKADLVSATTAYDSALRQQQMRATALSMFDKAQQDFDHINTIEDATTRARMSREWLSRYSQLANIKEIGPQVAQMNDLAVRNTETPIKLAALKTADERAFDAYTANMTPEQKQEAREIKAGLRARAVGAAPKFQEVTNADGSKTLFVADPQTGQLRAPTMADISSAPSTPQAAPTGQAANAPVAPAPQPVLMRGPTPGETERQKQDAQVASELQAAKPKRQAALRDAEANVSSLLSLLDELEKEVGPTTVGLGGAASASIPGTPAYAFNVKLQDVTARIATQALQKMREASPTGGALGNASDKDINLLKDQLGAIRQGLGEREFLRAVDRLKDNMQGTLERQKQFFDEQYAVARADISKMSDEELAERARALRERK